jgi:hypothetical protein
VGDIIYSEIDFLGRVETIVEENNKELIPLEKLTQMVLANPNHPITLHYLDGLGKDEFFKNTDIGDYRKITVESVTLSVSGARFEYDDGSVKSRRIEGLINYVNLPYKVDVEYGAFIDPSVDAEKILLSMRYGGLAYVHWLVNQGRDVTVIEGEKDTDVDVGVKYVSSVGPLCHYLWLTKACGVIQPLSRLDPSMQGSRVAKALFNKLVSHSVNLYNYIPKVDEFKLAMEGNMLVASYCDNKIGLIRESVEIPDSDADISGLFLKAKREDLEELLIPPSLPTRLN